jgi:hypothetical protein
MYNQQDILNQLDKLQGQIEEIRNFLLHSDNSKRRSRRKRRRLTIEDYHTYLSWQDKIVFILKFYNKPLLSSDMVSFMDDFDTVFKDKWTQLDKMKMLSTHINRSIKKGIITRFKQNGIRGYYYSLPATNKDVSRST